MDDRTTQSPRNTVYILYSEQQTYFKGNIVDLNVFNITV